MPERQGSDWHRAALADARLELPGVRPAILDDEAERHWDELRRFRHFLRHAYLVDLDPGRLRANRDHLASALECTAPRVEALLSVLGE